MSFRNQLVSQYYIYVDAASYYSRGIQYSNSSERLLAINQMSNARAVLSSAYDSISDLNTRFTGLPYDYYAAVSNMINAIDSLNKAIDLVVQSEGTSLDYSSSVNSHKDTSSTYKSRVRAFIDANSY